MLVDLTSPAPARASEGADDDARSARRASAATRRARATREGEEEDDDVVLVEASKTKRRRASLDVVVTGEATRTRATNAREVGGARARAGGGAGGGGARGDDDDEGGDDGERERERERARTVRGVPGRLRERDDDEVWTRVLRAVRASGDRAQRDVPDVSEKGDEGAVSSRVSVSPGRREGSSVAL